MKEGSNGKPKWSKTSVPNLLKNRDTGKYYFRASISRDGKRREVWKSLKTTVLTVAKLRLIDEQAKIEHQRQSESALDGKDVTLGQLGEIYKQSVNDDADLEQSSKEARLFALSRLWNTWPGLSALPACDVGSKDCERWLNAFKGDGAGLATPKKGKAPGSTTVNTTVDCLRRLFKIAADSGFIYRNPAGALTYKKPPRKHLRLPDGKQFRLMLEEIAKNPYAPGAADTVALLGYSGIRSDEGMRLKWSDVDFEHGLLHVSGTKSDASFRTIPLFPPLRALLERLHTARKPKRTDAILKVRDCQKSLDTAAETLEIPRMVHHDLRHFFISSCIEAGIDFLTISRWVGHADGGVLISRTYGHLRREYSMEAAKRMTFGEERSSIPEKEVRNA